MTTPIVPAMKPSASPEREALEKVLRAIHPEDDYCEIADAILAAGFRRDPGWIAVSERMPGDRELVLVAFHSFNGRRVMSDNWDAKRNTFHNAGSDAYAWMPWPLPPAPDDNDKAREGMR
jgi:hypothetical protein